MSAVPAPVRDVEDMIPADCHGMNFYESDPAFRILLEHYMAPDLHGHLVPHLDRLGALAGGRLDELARIADRHARGRDDPDVRARGFRRVGVAA